MLKKNLVRSGFLSHGLLFLVPNTTTLKIEPHFIYAERGVAYKPTAVFNDTLNTGPDSTMAVMPAPQIQLNKHAVRFVNSFLKKEDEFLQKMKDRSPSYFRVINGVFDKYGIPTELKYLAIVESQLRTTAVSKVGAKGLWQFMPVTARELGLKVSGKTDERTHFYKSTVAAAKYLKSLYGEFGDWLLVLAAYNGGPGTVYKAMKKSGSKNYWALQQYLPEESRGHVKRFIGVHYFFEGCGSIVTQTKAEALAYQKLLAEHQSTVQLTQVTKDTVAVVTMALK
jgi:membrane-bound lytic murein transglycosylase D